MTGPAGLTVVVGGQKSGKSGLAARRAAASGRPVTVVTPAIVRDDEFAARVARHRADRPAEWRTVETFDLAGAVASAGADAFVLVDALDTWLAERLERAGLPLDDTPPDADRRTGAEKAVIADLGAFAAAVERFGVEAVVIAGQPGLGVHAAGPGARAYVDLHGIALQALSAVADEVLLVIAGRALPLPLPVDHATVVRHAGMSEFGERSGGAEPRRVEPQLHDQRELGGDEWARLRDHGDRQVPPGAADLAVNVEPGPPGWLAARLAEVVPRLDRYPDDGAARRAVGDRHGRSPAECLPVNGAAEAFWLLAHVLRPVHAACVHPSFTEPEAALRAAGVPVTRVQRDPDGWGLDPAHVPADADLVVLGRPDNPTGAVDPAEVVERLIRPGRLVVVDEAFAEFLPDAGGFADRADLTGVVAVRSLTKLWGLAGLRVGYLTGPASLIERLAGARQPWSCNSLALTAIEALVPAEDDRRLIAAGVATRRRDLLTRLESVPGLTIAASPANFVLISTAVRGARDRLLDHGLAARRADTFPGLDDRSLRVAVRDPDTHTRLAAALRAVIEGEQSWPDGMAVT